MLEAPGLYSSAELQALFCIHPLVHAIECGVDNSEAALLFPLFAG